MLCIIHNIYFNPEINEDCYQCEAKKKECKHINKGEHKLFGTKRYLGLAGEWDICYDCGTLIKI